MKGDQLGTTAAFNAMIARQGGSLNFSSDTPYPSDSVSYITGNHYPEGTKPFIVSIYNQAKDERSVSLYMLINPKDLQIGQVNMVSNAYTRRGWVSTIWGRQQATITATGSSAGFYVDSNTVREGGGTVSEGLVNYSRKNSLAFINFQTLVALFKNCGQYYINSPSEQTIFKDGRSRVIHVMDQVMISYDEVDYLGSFNTFTIDERAEMPYRLEYNFEFVISGLRGFGFEGHLRMNDNDKDSPGGSGPPEIEFAIQGSEVTLAPYAVLMDSKQASKDYNLDTFPLREPAESLMSQQEIDEEIEYYREQYRKDFGTEPPPPGQPTPAVPVAANTVRVTQGGDDADTHVGNANAIDYRTSSGEIRSLTDGKVVQIYDGGPGRKALHFIVIASTVKGKLVHVRYFHLDMSTTPDTLKEGSTITAGTLLGGEGTDGGEYTQHCHFEVREPSSKTGNFIDLKSIPARSVFNSGVQTLKTKGYSDYNTVQYKHGKKRTP